MLDSALSDAEMNRAFTADSPLSAKMHPNRKGLRNRTGQMSIFLQLRGYVHSVREFVVPSYHPERHYMRGPGPACARRHHENRGTFA